MNLSEYQKQASTTAIYPDILQYLIDWMNSHNYDMVAQDLEQIQGQDVTVPNFYYPALGLAGEAGEFCNKIKKVMRDDKGIIPNEKKQVFIDELGDILWYLAGVATELDIDLGEVAERNLEKLFSRKERGKLGGSGDDR